MRTNSWLTGVRAVVFDAVGTLITPDPPAPAVYADVGRRHGSRLEPDVIASRFRAAFRAEEELDRAAGWRTSDNREERRWRAIVAATLDDVADLEACFGELWLHFARPGSWRCDPTVGRVIPELWRRGFTVGMASNFDGRLRTVVAGLPAVAALRPIVISSEVGWRKPAAEFFQELVKAVGRSPAEVLHVGDDVLNDCDGALAAGLRALHVSRIGSLAELL
jgi:putative hydrolase of the HAD superfamily